MAVIIKYNGSDPFKTNGIPTPFVGRDSEHMVFGSKRCVKDVITLTGQVPGCDHSTLVTRRTAISSAFSSNYKTLSIEDDSVEILSKEFSKIKSVSFDDSKYVGELKYTITIECYDETLHNEFYGITNPVDETKISLNEDKTYSINRTISAEGLNLQDGNLESAWLDTDQIEHTTSKSSSLQNAIDFVESMSGPENVILPSDSPNLKIYLKSKSENINRIKGQYSISESYVGDSVDTAQDHGILTYSTSISSSFSQNKSVSIKGLLSFGVDSSFSLIRNRFSEINFHELAEAGFGEKLVRFPLSVSVSERISSGSIEFEYEFDNDFNFNECGVSNAQSYSISSVGENISVSVSGEVSARGPTEKRWDIVKDEFYNNVKPYLYQNAKTKLESVHPTATPTHTPTVCGDNSYSLGLNGVPDDFSVKENRQKGTISYSYHFSNLNKISGFQSFDYSVSINMPVPKYSIDMNAGASMSKYIITRSGNTKGSASVNVGGIFEESNNKQQAEITINNKMGELLNEIKCSFIDTVPTRNLGATWGGIVSSGSTNYPENSNEISRETSVEYYEQTQ